MKNQITEQTRILLENSWRLTPARMAEHLTAGRFQRYKHVQYLEKTIAQKIGRGGARLVISMPPRHGKSWLASLFTPAWFLSLWPDKNVILASHDAAQAAAWGREVRSFLQTHQSALGPLKGGSIVTTGVGGPISGHGGHLLVVDDPIKNWTDASSESVRQKQIAWFNSTLYTRAEPGASIIVIMTRWHENDLAGYLESEHGDEWDVLRIPALAEDDDLLNRRKGTPLCEERYGIKALEQIRSHLGSKAWSALYQQKPSDTKDKPLKQHWFRRYLTPPEHFDEIIQAWDLTFKDSKTSDYVVGQVWGRVGTKKYLVDQIRGKMDFFATIHAIHECHARYPQTTRTLIEDKANGSAAISVLKKSLAGVAAVEPEGAKTDRVRSVSAEIEAGEVFIPDPLLAAWVDDFAKECAEFPDGKHDDQIDAMAYALKYFRKETQNARTQLASGAYLPNN